MKKENIIKEKSFRFAVRIINLYKVLNGERKEFILCKQVLRSGTSIGANVRESLNAEFQSVYKDANELLKIIRSIILSKKKQSVAR